MNIQRPSKSYLSVVLVTALSTLIACTQTDQQVDQRQDDKLRENKQPIADSRTDSPEESDIGAVINVPPAPPPLPRQLTGEAEDQPNVTHPSGTRELRERAQAYDHVSGVAGKAEFNRQYPATSVYPHSDPLAQLRYPDRPVNTENYAHFNDNPVHRVSEQPVSTFSIDVDSGSYANVRRMLKAGQLPPEDAVRVEEMLNYFDYNYPVPDSNSPFNVVLEQSVTPWNPTTRLLQIGIKGYQPPADQVPAANLVFLIDVSGSMQSADKLELLKNSFKLMTRQLDGNDRVAMVVYAGATGVVLESTAGDQTASITAALDQLRAGGSTNGGAGIELAYAQAQQGFIQGGINRVILATDGDFNVGMVDFEALKDLAERKRETGISLTTLGFGTGNYNDQLMEQLADAGNGNYHYIDTLGEARKVLVDELGATLQTIAKDVKIQVEFNPAVVAEYRLIGYENRVLQREDFNNDKVDAGDIGAGHTVTALYEVALVNSSGETMDELRYQQRQPEARPAFAGNQTSAELGFLRLRYKAPDGDVSRLIEQPIEDKVGRHISPRLQFASAVAAFGQHLRGGKYLHDFDLDAIHQLASQSKGNDPFGYRGEFLQLVRLADGFDNADSRKQVAVLR